MSNEKAPSLPSPGVPGEGKEAGSRGKRGWLKREKRVGSRGKRGWLKGVMRPQVAEGVTSSNNPLDL